MHLIRRRKSTDKDFLVCFRSLKFPSPLGQDLVEQQKQWGPSHFVALLPGLSTTALVLSLPRRIQEIIAEDKADLLETLSHLFGWCLIGITHVCTAATVTCSSMLIMQMRPRHGGIWRGSLYFPSWGERPEQEGGRERGGSEVTEG